MKKICMLFVSMLMLFISGCSKNPLGSPGMLSFYSGEASSNNHASLFKSIGLGQVYFYSTESYIYIDSIEISTNGNEWIKVFSGSMEVKVKSGETIKIASTIDIPEDEYHGIRITIEPKVKFVEGQTWYANPQTYSGPQYSNFLLEKAPYVNVLGGSAAGGSDLGRTTTILFTSANGRLVPFTVKKGKETFIVFGVRTLGDGSTTEITDWLLSIESRATQFIG